MLASKLEVVERRIRTLVYEHAYAFAPDGTLILDTTDLAPASVGFTADQLSLLRDAVLTHNHPGGRSLSPSDLLLAMEADLAQIRAVTASHRCWINRPLRGWTPEYRQRARTAITAEKALLILHMRRDISGGRISPEAADRGFHHLLWSNLASRGIVRYAHEPWENGQGGTNVSPAGPTGVAVFSTPGDSRLDPRVGAAFGETRVLRFTRP